MSTHGGGVRAFEAKLLLSNIRDNPNLEITAVEMFQEYIWIGTSTGVLIAYSLSSTEDARKRQLLRWCYVREAELGSRPITMIKVAPAAEKLFVLCENKLSVLYTHNLEIIQRLNRGVSMFCVNEAWRNETANSPFEISCLSTKSVLTSYEFIAKALSPDKRLNEQKVDMGSIQAMAREGRMVVMAQKNVYYALNLLTGTKAEITPVGSRDHKPHVLWLMPDEFLVATRVEGCSLGISVSGTGQPKRAPIQWVEHPESIAFSHPYVVAFCRDSAALVVNSVLDQAPVQVIDCKDGRLFNDAAQGILLTGRGRLSLLQATSFESQIHDLITAKRVDEALTLVSTTLETELEKAEDPQKSDDLKRKLRRIKRQAGFHEIANKNFQHGFELLQESSTSPQVVLALFPLVASEAVQQLVADPVYCPIRSISEVVQSKQEQQEVHVLLAAYLESVHDECHASDRLAVDTALVIIYALYQGDKLAQFVQREDSRCDLNQCSPVLTKEKKLHV